MSESPSEVARRVLSEIEEAREGDTCHPELLSWMEGRDVAVLARAYLLLSQKYDEAQDARYQNLSAAQTTSGTLVDALARLEGYREVVDAVLEWRESPETQVLGGARSDVEAKLWRLADKERVRRAEQEQ